MSEVSVQTEWLPALAGARPSPNSAAAPPPKGAPRVKPVDRQQLVLRAVDLELLIEPEHPARAIWEFTGRLDLSGFYAPIESVAGVAGRPAWDPRLLMSLWIYAYSRGISSARELARRCGYDPGFQWLSGLAEINYHTLADFRVGFGAELDKLFPQVLGVLSAEGLISLERVMHDGTKIKACASSDSFRRQERLRAHLEAARQQVQALSQDGSDYGELVGGVQRVEQNLQAKPWALETPNTSTKSSCKAAPCATRKSDSVW